MATKLTSIHRANDANGFSVSFQIDHEVGADDFQMHVTHSSPSRLRETEIDVPLTELNDLIESLIQIRDETPTRENWCFNCKGSGEVPISAVNTLQAVPCGFCGGKGMVKNA